MKLRLKDRRKKARDHHLRDTIRDRLLTPVEN
jgi:hypothetical protein